MSFAIARPQSPGCSGTPAPKVTTRRETTFGVRPFFAGSVFGAGTSLASAASSRSITIVARLPKTRALAAA